MTADRPDVHRHLRHGEHLLWTGRPDPRVHVTSGDVFLIPVTLLWCGFAVFWETSALRSGAPLLFRLSGIPFVLVGLYVVAGRFAVKNWRKRRTVYAVTDQRALVLTGARSVVDAPLRGLAATTTLARDGRHATVLLGPAGATGWRPAMYANSGMEFFTRSPAGQLGFFDVEDGSAMTAALDRARGSAQVAGN